MPTCTPAQPSKNRLDFNHQIGKWQRQQANATHCKKWVPKHVDVIEDKRFTGWSEMMRLDAKFDIRQMRIQKLIPQKLCDPINQDNDANEHGKGIMKTLEYARIISQFSVKGRPLWMTYPPAIKRCNWKLAVCLISGWWYTYPFEKYESQFGWFFPIDGKSSKSMVPNNQGDNPIINPIINHH